MKIRDVFKDPNQPWMYPFAKVKKDPIEGWFIKWSEEEPGYIPDPSLVSIGDLVSDTSLNVSPYWKVTGIVENTIFLEPFGENPFLTGIGAGGAILTDIDYKVFSGEAEKEIIDRKLRRIHEKQYADYNDIAYILLGTKPFRFGPNGSEGGWYTATDWHTRGYNKGMTPQEIMMNDAVTVQKLGLEVPPTALDGTLDPYLWNKLVEGSKERIEEIRLPGEDWDDPLTCARFILTHPQPQIRRRNAEALRELLSRQQEFIEGLNALRESIYFPDRNEDPEGWEAAREELNALEDAFKRQWQDDPEIAELSYGIANKLFYSQHPTFTKYPNFDAYWFTKELFINIAKDYCWIDILHLYMGSRDSTNRKYVAWALKDCNDSEALEYMVENDKHPEPVLAALHGLKDIELGETYPVAWQDRKKYPRAKLAPDGILFNTIDSNIRKLKNLGRRRGDDDPIGYYRDELNNFISGALKAREFFFEHKFWPSFFY